MQNTDPRETRLADAGRAQTDLPSDTVRDDEARDDDARDEAGVPLEAAGLPPEPAAPADEEWPPARATGTAAVPDAYDTPPPDSAVEPLPAGSHTEPEVVGEDAGTVYAGAAYPADGAGTGSTMDGEPVEGMPGEVEPVSALWNDGEVNGYRERWRDLQLRFVDDPHGAAADAGGLLGEVMDGLTAALATRREDLDSWRSAEGAGTEAMRVAFTRYRQFFEHVLEL